MMEDDSELDDVLGDSNSGAYQKQEIRQGPPLSYIAEKMGSSLRELHRAINLAYKQREKNVDNEAVLLAAKGAFQYELVAYCALHNLLAMVNDPGLAERLLSRSPGDFEEWLRNTASEGSVTG